MSRCFSSVVQIQFQNEAYMVEISHTHTTEKHTDTYLFTCRIPASVCNKPEADCRQYAQYRYEMHIRAIDKELTS